MWFIIEGILWIIFYISYMTMFGIYFKGFLTKFGFPNKKLTLKNWLVSAFFSIFWPITFLCGLVIVLHEKWKN
jgi:hypothetical protein